MSYGKRSMIQKAATTGYDIYNSTARCKITIRYNNIGNRSCIDMIYAIMHNFDNIDFRTKMTY